MTSRRTAFPDMGPPLKFCMMTTFYPPYNFGGDGICVYRLANELARRGHLVDVIHSVDAYSIFRSQPAAGEFPNHPNVRVIGLKSRVGLVSALLTQQTGMPYFQKQIKELVENRQYDVIHYHNMSLIGLTALEYGTAVKLYTMHEHWLVCPMHVLWKFNREVCTKKSCVLCSLAGNRPPQLWRYTGLLDRALKHVDCFISPSEFTLHKHRELGPDLLMTCIPHFLPKPPDEESLPDENVTPRTQPYFLFVGRLEKIKGVQNLIPVFQRHREYDLLIAGDGKYQSRLERLAGDSRNIKFLGRMSASQLQHLYRGAVAVMVPSICYEVFGLILIEAFSMKTPVIVNNLGALPEVVQASGGGYVYNTPEELGQWVERLGQNPQLRNELGNKGFQAYLKYWTADAHLEQYFNLVNPLLERHRQRTH